MKSFTVRNFLIIIYFSNNNSVDNDTASNKSEPDDYVFATGELHSVKDFVNTAFSQVGIVLDWSGDSLNEIARNRSSQNLVVKIDEAFYRPGDIKGTCGNAAKAKLMLGGPGPGTIGGS